MLTPVSIILCTRNRVADLRHTLASIAALDVPEHLSVEVILVDNGSEDGTLGVMCAFDPPNMAVRIVQEPQQGKARACNAGIRASQGSVLLFTDDDVRLPRQWIQTMCEPILSGAAEAVAGGVVLAPHLRRCWLETSGVAGIMAATETLSKDRPQRLVGASMSFSRKILERVPLFDPELGPGALGFEEETLFSLQLTRAGYRIASAFDTPVEHHLDPERLSRASFLSNAEKLGRSMGYIDYHWRHQHAGTWKESRLAQYVILARAHVLSSCARMRSRLDSLRQGNLRLPDEGIQRREMLALRRMFAIKQYIDEQKRPHNYDRYGLVKKLTADPGKPPLTALQQARHVTAAAG